MLSVDETNHYQRHLSLPLIGVEGQGKLKNSSVLVIGAGGLGCPVLQYLAAAGIGKIGIIDDDVVEVSNLHRQVLYNMADIGKSKAMVASQKISEMNPFIKICPYTLRIDTKNAESLLKEYDIIVDGTDNFSSRYLINDACVLYNKVLVYGAIFQFEGQVSIFNFNGGPTYRCLFPEPPKSNSLPNCSEAGVLGVLPGIIGSLQALEVIKLVTGVGNVLSGRVLLYDALAQKSRIIKLNLQPQNRKILKLDEISTQCENQFMMENEKEIVELDPKQLEKKLKEKKDLLILDVRESWERELSKISHSLHIPLGEFLALSSDELPDEISKQKNILVYCKAGVRSRMACESLQEKGFTKLFNLSGGMMAWEEEGYINST